MERIMNPVIRFSRFLPGKRFRSGPVFRRSVFFCSVALSFFSGTPGVSATTYYVDATGGADANTGLSEGVPWQTLSKVSSTTLAAGDQVLFKRGETFSGKLICHNSGVSGNPIVYADYGTGNKPVLTGSNAEGIVCWGKDHVTIRNLAVGNATTYGLTLSSDGIILDGVESSSNPSGGLFIDTNRNISDLSILRSKFINNGGRGVNFYANFKGRLYQRLYFDAVEATGNAQAGIYAIIAANSSLFSSWTLSSGNVWYAALANYPQNGVLFNGVSGTEVGSIGAIIAPNQWYWDSGTARLYVYSAANPSVAYTQPGIEAPSKFYDVRLTDSVFANNGAVAVSNNSPGLTFGGSPWSLSWSVGPTGWSDGIVVDNVVAYGNGYGGISVSGFKSDVIQSYVKNSEAYGNGQVSTLGGIWTGSNDGLIIEKNLSHDNTTPAGGIDGVGIFVDQWDTDCIVRYNEVYGNLGSAVTNSGHGIAFWNSMDNAVYGNVVRDNKDGIVIGHASSVGNKIYNNTVVDNTRYQIGYWLSAIATSAEIKNNILSGGQYGIHNSSVAPSSEDYNCVGGASVASYSGLTPGAHSNAACSPSFTDAANDGFTIQRSSQAVDAGADLGATYRNALSGSAVWPGATVTTGDQADYGSGWEMGAYIFDPTPPSIAQVFPVDGSTGISADADLAMTFNEVVTVQTGAIVIRKRSDDSIVESIDVTSGSVTGGGTTVITVNPTMTFLSGETYYVQVPDTAFDDADGNAYAGIQDMTSWDFSTAAAPSEEAQKAEISSWKAYLRDNKTGGSCGRKLVLKIRGRYFTDRMDVEIGNKRATSVDRKSSRLVEAAFCHQELLNIRTGPVRQIKVTNPDADTEKAKKKIDLDRVYFRLDADDFSMYTTQGITNIQSILVKTGYLLPANVTGSYDSAIISAVRRFQSDRGLSMTGLVGPLTRGRLAEESFR